jgi:hypothetical protein
MKRLLDAINEIDTRIAVAITNGFGTMWAFWVCCLWSAAPALPALVHCQPFFLYWSNAVQLAALPALAVGQKILGRAFDVMMARMYKYVESEFKIVKRVQREQHAMHRETHRSLARLEAALEELKKVNGQGS